MLLMFLRSNGIVLRIVCLSIVAKQELFLQCSKSSFDILSIFEWEDLWIFIFFARMSDLYIVIITVYVKKVSFCPLLRKKQPPLNNPPQASARLHLFFLLGCPVGS